MESGITVEKIKEWLVYTASLMVANPSKVEVNHKNDERGILFTLKVDPSDAGKILGKVGAHVKALRELLHMLGMNAQARISLQVDVPERPAGYERREPDREKYV